MSKVWYQGILKATISGVFQDLKFKISEGLDQNWSCPESALYLAAQRGNLKGNSVAPM